jgi:flagellin-like hook-associated protein FlgL
VEAAKGLASAALGTSNTTDRSAYADQFGVLLEQIDTLASDSGYRGTNLLTADNLTVNFNEDASATLTVTGFDSTSTGLTIDSAVASWAGTTNITDAQNDLGSASIELRKQSKNLANNLNIITTRQNFTDSMIGALQTGADNLTLADMNQEGANMLMLQTRQNLGTTALSLSSQAAQSVLRLF